MNNWLASGLAMVMGGAVVGSAAVSLAAEVILPAKRAAYYAHERIELAVAGLEAGAAVDITLAAAGAEPVRFTVTGDGGTQVLSLPPNSLAPGTYAVQVGDQSAAKTTLHISRGVWPSTMLVSQTGKEGYKNFILANAFNFGIHGPDGQPLATPRARTALGSYENLVKGDLPAIIYMYWTGYVLHKPWGIHKEWASADMIENMRLFNFHVAQRLRRFDHLVHTIGSLDEPGLPWGRTAAGGSASGFTGWNVADWMAERGLEWTDDPGSLSDEDFRKYMQLRALMLREPHQQANQDIKAVWPTAVYGSDLYAPHAVGDGTEPLNQIANDVPTTHVFADWGYGKPGVLAGMYLEKAHAPASKIAHAMNGQLFGARVPQPQMRHAYHLMLNVLLAAGLDSNWWLNHGGMGQEDLDAVNQPAARLGPIFQELAPSDHDVAVLWSNTEIRMRVKGLMQAQASQADGKQIALMVADMPEDAVGEDGKLKYNAYSVGQNYKGEVITTFMAINRAGWPAHILHEERLAEALDQYKVLVIARQTHELPAERRAAIEAWVARGGTLIVDATSTVPFAGALEVDAPSVVNQGYAWGDKFGLLRDNQDDQRIRELSYFQSNHFMESFSRAAAPIFAKRLAQTPARRVLLTDAAELLAERHVGGDTELIMVINCHEELPPTDDTQAYHIYNYAPHTATYSLPIIAKGRVVYKIEGLDWQTVSKVDNPTAPQTESFQPGEMKLYLVTRRQPQRLALHAATADGLLQIEASLRGKRLGLFASRLKTAWPLEVVVKNPASETVVSLYRSLGQDGRYAETIPLGLNAAAGAYAVSLSSPLAGLAAATTVNYRSKAVAPLPVADPARVFDGEAIRALLADQPAVAIAVANPAHQPMAEQLAASLRARGVRATVKAEAEVWRKALYPRVWDPYAPVFTPNNAALKPLPDVQKLDDQGKPVRGEDGKPIMVPGQVVRELTVNSAYYETPTYTTPDGQDFAGRLAPGTLLTVGDHGYVQIGGQETFYEPGVKLFVGDRNQLTPLNAVRIEVKTTADFRAKWARPWQRLVGHVGGFNLTPQLPEAYAADEHLILLGDSASGGTLVRALQASELLPQTVDELYPGPGKALIQFAWSPFALEKNVIFIGASDLAGLQAGVSQLLKLAP